MTWYKVSDVVLTGHGAELHSKNEARKFAKPVSRKGFLGSPKTEMVWGTESNPSPGALKLE